MQQFLKLAFLSELVCMSSLLSPRQFAAAIGVMFENPKTVALGIASTPSFNADPDGRSRQAALNLIEGAIKGARSR